MNSFRTRLNKRNFCRIIGHCLLKVQTNFLQSFVPQITNFNKNSAEKKKEIKTEERTYRKKEVTKESKKERKTLRTCHCQQKLSPQMQL
jgi:hypothetical protein